MSKGVSNSYVMRTQIVSRNEVPYDMVDKVVSV